VKRPPAVAALVSAALVFALMAVATKVAARRLPGAQVAFIRFAIGLGSCALARVWVPMRAHNKLGLVMRGAYGGAAVLFYFMAIAHLPVGIATLLNYTAPVFTAIYAGLFMGEAIKRATLAALALTSAGVALVIAGTAPPGSLAFGPWQLVGLVSAVLSGAAVATIRQVRKTDGSWEVFTAFCVAGAVITLAPAVRDWIRPTPGEWLVLAAVGVTSVIGQLLMTHSLRYVPAAAGGVIIQLTPVTSLAIGWAFLNERIGAVALGGAALTLAGVSLGTYLAAGRGESAAAAD